MRMRNIRNPTLGTKECPLTSHRHLLLKLIRRTKEHLDPKELYRLASNEDKSISLATVYRNLRLFKELGLVDERHLGQVRCYYEIRRSAEHHHLVCQGCGKVTEFVSPLIRRLLDKVEREHGFKVTRAELYLEGCCQQCDEEPQEKL